MHNKLLYAINRNDIFLYIYELNLLDYSHGLICNQLNRAFKDMNVDIEFEKDMIQTIIEAVNIQMYIADGLEEII